jgi:hypothetical protein
MAMKCHRDELLSYMMKLYSIVINDLTFVNSAELMMMWYKI